MPPPPAGGGGNNNNNNKPLHYEELLFFAACVCNGWGVCLCVCVCLERRGGCGGAGGGGGGGGRGCAGGMRLQASSWRWQLSRAMRLALRWCRRWRLFSSRRSGGVLGGAGGGSAAAWSRASLGEAWSYGRLLLRSLYHNALCNSDTMLDAAFEPVYWIVDNVTRWFGVVFVSLVVVLTGSVLVIVYACLLPVVLSTYPVQWVAWHLCYGHWLLLMTCFHYYKATTTAPGHPPKDKTDIPSVSMCKKCIVPKPARTHHCSICNVCILKMDHHCPWLNNCVGHFNHRYFFSFCLYMTLGCMYCSVSCKDMFLEAYDAVEQYRLVQEALAARQGVPDSEMRIHSYNMTGQSYYQTPPPTYTFRETTSHKSVIFLWVLTSSVAVALGGLTLWHSILITRGETSVERHINNKETRRLRDLGKGFRNPYHHGKINNWKIFLGVEKRSHWVTRVLLPSGHLPGGDGIAWECSFGRHDDPMAI